MSREEAEALAAKREAHKPKSLHDKSWQAVHNSVKGWHVALVESPIFAEIKQLEVARAALRAGDMSKFHAAAEAALLARCARIISATEIPHD